MKRDWKTSTIENVCDVLTDGNWIESKDQSDCGIRLVQTGNVGFGVYKDKDDKARYISTETLHRLNCTEIYEGDILVSRLPEPVGRACIVPNTGDRMITSVDCSIIRLNKEMISPFFIYYSCSRRYYQAIARYITGAVRKRISRSNLSLVSIPVPPLEEQERIVEELDCLRGIIDKKKAQLTELDNLAKSIFYEMFGDPITNEKGWEMHPLKDVAEIVGGSTPKTNIAEYWKGNNYWVTPAELHGNHYISKTERCISDEAVKKTNLSLLPVGTILLSSRAPIGKVSITKVPMYSNQGFKSVICSNKLNNEYVYHLLLYKTSFLNALGTGATFKEISKSTTEKIRIAVPPRELQNKFAQCSVSIEAQKELIKKSIAETEVLFNSRMDYYFN